MVLLILGKEAVLPAIIPSDYTSPDVQAWSFPMIALLLMGIGLGGRGARLRHDAAPLPEGLARDGERLPPHF